MYKADAINKELHVYIINFQLISFDINQNMETII